MTAHVTVARCTLCTPRGSPCACTANSAGACAWHSHHSPAKEPHLRRNSVSAVGVPGKLRKNCLFASIAPVADRWYGVLRVTICWIKMPKENTCSKKTQCQLHQLLDQNATRENPQQTGTTPVIRVWLVQRLNGRLSAATAARVPGWQAIPHSALPTHVARFRGLMGQKNLCAGRQAWLQATVDGVLLVGEAVVP